jgi:hypothetical protein
MVAWKSKIFPTIGDMLRHRTFNRMTRATSLVKQERAKKQIIRAFQFRNNGRHPDLTVIPEGSNCCSYQLDVLGNSEKTLCPYWFSIKRKEAAILYGEDAVIGYIGTYLEISAGGCSLLNTDDYKENNLFSLLWYEVKKCPFNTQQKGVHI